MSCAPVVARALVVVTALVAVGTACDRAIKLTDDAIVTVDVTRPAAELPPGAVTFATFELPGIGGGGETKMSDEGGGRYTFQTALGVLEDRPTTATVRVYGSLDATTETAVLWIAEQPIVIAPGAEHFIGGDEGARVTFVDAADAAHPYLDVNRNERSNLGDLLIGCDPAVPPPFVRISASDVQLDADIQDRQVVVVDNLVDRPVTVSANVVDAVGVGVAVIEPASEQTVTLPDVDALTLDAGASTLLLLTFQPANPALTTGILAIKSVDSVAGEEDARCNTRASEVVRIIANSTGAPSTPAATAVEPALAPGADLGEFPPQAVTAFPLDNVASGAPLGVRLAAVPTGQTIRERPAEKGFVVDVPRGGHAAIAVGGAPFDVDLHVFKLADGDVLAAAPLTLPESEPLPGTSTESVDVIADAFIDDGADSLRLLVALGASGATEARLLDEEEAGALEASAQLTIHVVTTPRFERKAAPAEGPLSGGNEVELVGTGLVDGGRVLFGAREALCGAVAPAAGAENAGLRSITCTAPPGSLGIGENPVNVVYQTPPDAAGVSEVATLAEGFLYRPEQPVVASVEPSVVGTGGGTRIVVAGVGFTNRYGSVELRIDGAPVALESSSEQLLTAFVPPHAAGVVDVSVTIKASQELDTLTGTLVGGLEYGDPPAPAPVIASVSPPLGSVDGGTQITILGENFAPGAAGPRDVDVELTGPGGTAAATIVAVSATAIVANTPPVAGGGEGPVDVVVVNGDGQRDTLAGGFVYFAEPPPAPRIVAVTPAHGDEAGGTEVTILGDDFDPANARVLFDGIEASLTSAGAGVLFVVTPPHPAGLVDVVVENGPGGGGLVATAPGAFTYDAPFVPPPAILAVTPARGDDAGGTEVTLLGVDFDAAPGAAVVRFDGLSAIVTSAAPGALVVLTPAHAAGVVDVSVTNGDGQSDTAAGAFRYEVPFVPPPAILAVTPARGGDAGGTEVTILGVDFDPLTATVSFDGVDATVTNAAAGALVVVTPAHAAGVVDVRVENGDGQSDVAAGAYRYEVPFVPPPAIFTVSPQSGSTAGGNSVTILGDGFDDVAGGVIVRFDSVPATVTSAGAGALVVTAPAHAAGLVAVEVENGDGQSDSAPNAYRYEAPFVPPPAIFAVTPGQGDVAGGDTITILGESFDDGTAPGGGAGGPLARVFVDGAEQAVVSASTTALSVVTPAHAPGLVAVTVENADGQSDTLANVFRFAAPPQNTPVIVDVAPDPAHALVGFEQLTLLGDDLEDSASAVVEVGAGPNPPTLPATITTLSASLVRVLIDDPLPADTGTQQLFVALAQPDGSIARSPAFTAEPPQPIAIDATGLVEEGAPFSLIITGVSLNATKLSGVRATPIDPGSGSETTLDVAFGAETVVSVDVPGGALGRGGWTIALVYDIDGPGAGNDDELVVPVDVVEVGGACPGSALCDTCGDDLRDPGEQCDGADFGGVTCESLGFDGGALTCAGCQFDALTCTECGNSFKEAGESCDNLDLGGATCVSLGFTTGTLSCAADCSFNASQCSRCGDGACTGSETNANCAADCVATCGDGFCNATATPAERCSTCPGDCGVCPPYNLVLLSGAGQQTDITGTLPTEIRVRVVDDAGAGVPNVNITFAPEPGDVTTFATRVTNGSGEAGVAWSLGPRVGTHTLTMTAVSPDGTAVLNQPLLLDGTATDLAPGTIVTLAGDGDGAGGAIVFGQGNAGIRTSLGALSGAAVEPSGDVLILSNDRCDLLRLDMPSGVLARVIGATTGSNCGSVVAGGEGDGSFIRIVQPDGSFAPNPAVKLRSTSTVYVGPDGDIYIIEDLQQASFSDRVRRIEMDPADPEFLRITTVAGGGPLNQPQNGDGGPANQADLQIANGTALGGLAFAADGDLLISEAQRNTVRRVNLTSGDPDFGRITTLLTLPATAIDGNGVAGNTASGSITGPVVIIEESPALLYAASFAINRVGFGGDSMAICDAALCQMVNGTIANLGVRRGPDGFFYSGRNAQHRIDRFDGIAGDVVVTGTGVTGFSGDHGAATAAQIQSPKQIAFNTNGDLLFVDGRNTLRLVRGAVSVPNVVDVIATSGGGQTAAIVQPFTSPLRAAVTSGGQPALNARVRFTPASGGFVSVSSLGTDGGGFATTPVFANRFVGDGTPGAVVTATYTATLAPPLDRLFPAAVASFVMNVRQPNQGELMSAFYGSLTTLPATAASATVDFNTTIVHATPSFRANGDMFLSDTGNARLVRMTAAGAAEQVAGVTNSPGFAGDNGPPLNALLGSGALATALLPNGDVLIADSTNHRVRKVDFALNIITTAAGSGATNDSGNGGPAVAAGVQTPTDLAVQADGSFYIFGNQSLRFVDVNGNIQFVEDVLNAVCSNGDVHIIPGDARAITTAPDGRVLVALRALAGGGCPIVTGQYIFEVVDGFIDYAQPPVFFTSDVNTEIHALAVREDGVIFFATNPSLGTNPRVLKAIQLDGTVVTLGSAGNVDAMAFGPGDGLLYFVDAQTSILRIFSPPAGL